MEQNDETHAMPVAPANRGPGEGGPILTSRNGGFLDEYGDEWNSHDDVELTGDDEDVDTVETDEESTLMRAAE
jgi:hypothetical protein